MFQNMEYIYTVYQEQSFSKAAKKLFISQPSLSATIKRTERKIGYPIFDRSTKPLTLTECGQSYIRSVEQMLTIQTEFTNFINDLEDLKTGTLVLGGSSLYSSWILPPLMGAFTKRFPLVKLELIEETTAELAGMLQNGRIDLMLDNCLLDERVFDRQIFQKEHLLLAVPRSLKLSPAVASYAIPVEKIKDGSFLTDNLPTVPLSFFAQAPFILLKPDNDTRKRSMAILQEQHITPNIVFELDQQLTSYHVASSGMGISFLSDTLITQVPAHPNLIYYRLESDHCQRSLYFYWKSGRYISRTMEEFLKISAAHPS